MEAFGIATAVLQVADTGSLLARNLYECTRDIKDAKSDLCNIANEVDLTSKILKNFGLLLEDETTKVLCSSQLCADAQEALEGCRAAFNDLNDNIATFRKSGDRVRITRAARIKWPLTKSKTKAHQERLERLKFSLNLMLQMLHFAKNTNSSKFQQDRALEVDRLQLENLVLTNEPLIRRFTSETNRNGEQQESTRTLSTAPDETAPHHENPVASSRMVSYGSFRESWKTSTPEEDRISRQLQLCVHAASKLTESLQIAMVEWNASHVEPLQTAHPSFEHLCQDMSVLRGLLQAFSLASAGRRYASSATKYSQYGTFENGGVRRYSGGRLQRQAPNLTIGLDEPNAGGTQSDLQQASDCRISNVVYAPNQHVDHHGDHDHAVNLREITRIADDSPVLQGTQAPSADKPKFWPCLDNSKAHIERKHEDGSLLDLIEPAIRIATPPHLNYENPDSQPKSAKQVSQGYSESQRSTNENHMAASSSGSSEWGPIRINRGQYAHQHDGRRKPICKGEPSPAQQLEGRMCTPHRGLPSHGIQPPPITAKRKRCSSDEQPPKKFVRIVGGSGMVSNSNPFDALETLWRRWINLETDHLSKSINFNQA